MTPLLVTLLASLWFLGLINTITVDLTIEKSSFSNYTPEACIDFKNMSVKRFNRTHKMVVGTLEFLIDVGNNLEVSLEVYKKQGNEYRKTPFRIPRCSFCKFLQLETYNYPKFVKDSNLPPPGTCPIPKGVYTVTNHFVDVSKIPPYFDGHYWLRLKEYYENALIDEMNGYFEIRVYADQ